MLKARTVKRRVGPNIVPVDLTYRQARTLVAWAHDTAANRLPPTVAEAINLIAREVAMYEIATDRKDIGL